MGHFGHIGNVSHEEIIFGIAMMMFVVFFFMLVDFLNVTKVIELSGGDQQKVVLSTALGQKPKLIILDEPTRGVDVEVIAEIYDMINELADSGLPVVVSSYLSEILTLSDQIAVYRFERVV